MTRRTLLMASRLGARLVLADAVLEEVLGNLRASDYEFRNWFEAIEAHVDDVMARNAGRIMIRSYFYARLNKDLGNKRPGSWPTFINQFLSYENLHKPSATDELRRYLQRSFGMQHDSDADLEALVDQEQLRDLTQRLGQNKSNERLARNDELMRWPSTRSGESGGRRVAFRSSATRRGG